MRIAGGRWRGRTLTVPRTGLRPTTELVRQALFNILGDLSGLAFLDLYAGSGALGLEALSRGAARAVFVEQDRRAAEAIRANLAALGAGGAECRCQAVGAFLRGPVPGPFDVVLADPPYDLGPERAVLEAPPPAGLAALLAAGGRLVLELSVREPVPAPPGLVALRERDYGETRLVFFARAAEGGE